MIAIFIVLGGIVIYFAALFGYSQYAEQEKKKEAIKQAAEHRAKLAAAYARKTPEEKAAEAKAREEQAKLLAEKEAADKARKKAAEELKRQDERRFQTTAAFLSVIKQALRDPPSVAWETVLANKDGSVICVEYRARNGFGGYTREHAVYAQGKASNTASSWNAHCANRALNDMMHARHAIP